VSTPNADVPTSGTLPVVEQTTPANFGIPPTPSPQPSTNPLFELAEQRIPSAAPAGADPSEFDAVLRPFTAEAFATGFAPSGAGIGPLALAQAADGTIIVSGGAFRNQLYRFNPLLGGAPTTPRAGDARPADRQPGVRFRRPALGHDARRPPPTRSTTGQIVNRFGDGLNITLAISGPI
jgi:hypothetical protein